METQRYLEKQTQDTPLSEKLGQHFLIDPDMIDLMVRSTLPGAKVIEVGSGVGHVTEALARKAGSVIGIEIDRRFLPALEGVAGRNPNIRFIIEDVLHVSLGDLIGRDEEVQIVANLPFYVTEPFLRMLIDLPISNAVLILGDAAACELQEPEKSPQFGKMSLLGQTFFNINQLASIPRDSSYPPPRTAASMISLNPIGRKEIEIDSAAYIFASLFRRERQHGLVGNDMKQAIVESEGHAGSRTLSKGERNRKTRSDTRRELKQLVSDYRGGRKFDASDNTDDGARSSLILSQEQALRVMGKMGIPEAILAQPFFKLHNQDIQTLTRAVRNYYGR